jgi:hypothetical protein
MTTTVLVIMYFISLGAFVSMYLLMLKQSKDYYKLLKEYEEINNRKFLVHSDSIASLQGRVWELKNHIADISKKEEK